MPPPIGDARRLTGYEAFTLNGGMDAAHQQLAEDTKAALHHCVRDLFASLPDKRHFIFSSSCNTSRLTPWCNLLSFRDAARAYGRVDG